MNKTYPMTVVIGTIVIAIVFGIKRIVRMALVDRHVVDEKKDEDHGATVAPV
jgi:hypothetical protein